MKKDIKSAAAVESEAQTLETDKAASAAHDVQQLLRGRLQRVIVDCTDVVHSILPVEHFQ